MALAVLASCGTNRDGVLSADDVGSVDGVSTYNRFGTPFSGCAALGEAEGFASASDPDTVSKLYRTNDGDSVISALLGVPVNETTSEQTMTRLDDAITACSTASADFVRLGDLPESAIGFMSTLDASNGGYVTEGAFVMIDDKHVVALVVQREGGGSPERSVKDLLPKAVERGRAASSR